MRGKSTIRKLEEEDEEEEEEEEERQKEKISRIQVLRLKEEEMKIMVDDDPEIAMEEMKILGRLRKMATMPNEEEEILQTRIVSPREVSEHWDEWLPAIQCEVEFLLRDEEAFREVFPDELQRLKSG